MMKALYLVLSLAAACLPAQIVLTTDSLRNSSGVVVADGIATIQPTLCNGQSTAYRVPSVGAFTQDTVPAPVVGGALSIPVQDALLASLHICYAMKVRDRKTGAMLVDKGYEKMQPSASAPWCHMVSGVLKCKIDEYDPNLVPVVPIGPAGANGAPGQSAYQLAVANGFVGTQAQWLASLQGPAGHRRAARRR